MLSVAVLGSACGSGSTSSKSSGAAPSQGGAASAGSSTGNIDSFATVVSYEGAPDVGNLPSLIAVDAMKQKGYNIKTSVIADTPPEIAALRQGAVHIAYSNTISLLKADLSQPGLKAVAEAYGSQTVLVAPTKYADVQALAKDNLPVGLESPTSQMATLVSFTDKKYGVKLNKVYLPNSSSRADALLAGRLKASLLQIDDAAKVLGKASKDFHVILTYSELIPDNIGASEYVTTKFLNDHASIVQEFVSQYSAAIRHAYQDPAWFTAQGTRLLKSYGYTSDIIGQAVKQTTTAKIWGADGLITDPLAKATVDFNTKVAGITPDQVTKLGNDWYTTQFNAAAANATGG